MSPRGIAPARRLAPLAAGLSLLAAAALPAAGAVVPAGSELALNATVTGDQRAPSVAPLGSGFVAAWESDGQDESDFAVVARRFDAAGAALGDEIVVNLATADDQVAARVAPAGSGFVVSWQSYVSEESGTDVLARLFTAAGAPSSDEIAVGASAGDETAPAVAGSSGGFTVVWARTAAGDTDVVARRYGATGNALGGEVAPSTTRSGLQLDPDVGRASDGRAVVVWQSLGQDTSGWGVFARRYAANGTPLDAAEWQVPANGAGSQTQPVVAVRPDGSFLVAWNDFGRDGADDGVFAQTFAADGSRLGPELQVNVTVSGRQSFPSAAAVDDGYVVAWRSSEGDGSGSGVFARHVSATGEARGGEVGIASRTVGTQALPAVAALGTGAVAAWQSDGADGAGTAARGRRLAFVDARPCVASATALCLAGGRFEVTATWSTKTASGVAQAVALTADTGYLWFFAASNVEAVVKVLDGCALNGSFWVFAGGLTDVGVELQVRDSVTGTVRTYVNPRGTAYAPLQDTAAFSCSAP